MSENMEAIKSKDLNQDFSLERRAGKWGISNSTFKILAIVTMFIDHIAAVVLSGIMSSANLIPWASDIVNSIDLYSYYGTMRAIGRIAMPIFCYLIVQGYKHTKDFNKYATRLFIFALISEVPFDLAFSGELFNLGYQNVYFTLFLGLITIRILDKFQDKTLKNIVIRLSAVILLSVMATILNTDYGHYGILAIVLLYLFDNSNITRTLAGIVAFLFEAKFIIVFLPILLFNLYNGKRGLQLKYFFYAFYPVHLLLLYLLTQYITGVSI